MIPGIRIEYNGVNVRLVGFRFSKFDNLRILETGIASIKGRLAKGIGENDGPTKPLTKRYARFKAFARRKKAVRDLDLTGRLLSEIKPRYADDRQATADAVTRLGRLKARVHRDLLQLSDNDQKAMLEKAGDLFAEGAAQTVQAGRNLARAASGGRAAIQNRRTYFGRAA